MSPRPAFQNSRTPRTVRSTGSVLAALAVLALTACTAPPGAPVPTAGSTAGTAASRPTPAPDDTVSATTDRALASLETDAGARIGVHAVDTGSGRTVEWRAGERFAYASTIKALAAAVVLDRTTDAELAEVVTWDEDDLVEYSPVTEQHVEDGLPLGEVAESAITVSDNTAGNIIFDAVGGPDALEEALGALGDDVTRVDRIEPELNEAAPGDLRDTTTPQALAQNLRTVAVDDGLADGDRAQLVEWLRATTTGDDLVRAAAPEGWTVGDKTGSAGYGTRNDVAVLWPPDGADPVVIAVMTTHPQADAEADDALVAEAARITLRALQES